VPETIPIDRISTEGTQTRVSLNDMVIAEYAEAYEQGIELPPIDVYYDEIFYFLADGFHRLRAVQQIGCDSISANVHPGNRRDAILHAVGSNETHGLRRTNADRRQAVMLMLNDPEWSQWSNHAIARQCMVSEISVRRARRELEPQGGERAKDETRKAERRGKVYTIQTRGIGAAKRKQSKEPMGVAGKETEPPAFTAAATQEPVALQEQPADVLSTTLSQIDASTSTIPAPGHESSAETALVISSSTEPHVVEVVEKVPPIPAESDHRRDEALPDTNAPGHLSFDPNASTIPEAVLEVLTLERRWELATAAEHREFVTYHRDELQKIVKQLEKKAASS
jgi:hypothetical protein